MAVISYGVEIWRKKEGMKRGKISEMVIGSGEKCTGLHGKRRKRQREMLKGRVGIKAWEFERKKKGGRIGKKMLEEDEG